MKNLFGNLGHKTGLPPGTLIHVGEQKINEASIDYRIYSDTDYEERVCAGIGDCAIGADDDKIRWLNVCGLHDTGLIAEVGEHFSLHSLLLEDVLNTHHLPKVEAYDDHLFITLKMFRLDDREEKVISEHVSLILGKNWLLSFQESKGDVFDSLRTRLREHTGAIRARGADFLLYRLIDTLTDHYFHVLEFYNRAIDALEEEILGEPTQVTLIRLQQMRRELIQLRKYAAPLREVVSALERDETGLIGKGTGHYLRDVYEHSILVNVSIESLRDLLSSLTELYHSGVSTRMNTVMQVLTIIATIFIPLTFIAGIYGMNFDIMPELHWKYGYFGSLGLMVLIAAGMLVFFRHKRWL